MNKLQTSENNFEVMNVTVKFNELPKELQQYLRVCIYNRTDCYKWEGKCDWDNLDKSVIGFQVYKDYYKCLSLYYPSKDSYYSSIGLGNIYNQGLDLTEFINQLYPISLVTKQLETILTNREVIRDYDYENLQEAISSGDSAWVDEIVGDRDLFELI